MPSLNAVHNETSAVGSGHDVVRRKYIRELSALTGRNTIVYYSGWLQKGHIRELQPVLSVNDQDKNGFMATVHELHREDGLDLLLHTPGGDAAATESIVDYLRQMFGTNIRAFVPQLAMSAGTMMALACKQIVMGKHSNLGPIDPQIAGLPAHGIIEEFKRAQSEIASATNQQEYLARTATWQPIIAKYSPALIGECVNAINWSSSIVTDWLKSGMFEGEADGGDKAAAIVSELSSHEQTKTHARHIHVERLQELGVKVVPLEDDNKLQDAVLTVHHACMHTLQQTPAVKIIENQNAISFIIQALVQQIAIPAPPAIPPTPRAAEPGTAPTVPIQVTETTVLF